MTAEATRLKWTTALPTTSGQKNEAASDDVDDDEDRLVIEEEDYRESGQDPSLGTADDEKNETASDVDDDEDRLVIVEEDYRGSGQDGKLDCNPGWRKKSRKKMEHAKIWIENNLVFERNSVCLLQLSDISSKYLADCERDGREPLLISVLCRLLHQQFTDVGKCRLGPRGKQTIHYTKLRWRQVQQCNSTATPLTSAIDERAEEGSTSPQMHDGSSTEPQSGRGVERKQTTSDLPSQLPAESDDEGQKECEEAGTRLQQVVKVFLQGKRDILLKTFAHSASCYNISCFSLCLMFRRVRRHVVNARHECHVLRIYSLILKMHVATCVANDCGLTACPALRASKQNKRGLDAEQQQQQEEIHQSATKRLNVQDDNNLPCALPRKPSAPSQSFAPLLSSMPAYTTQPLRIMLVTVPPTTEPNVRV
nr:MAG: RFX DNA-binding domain-containing protein [Sesarmops intermedium nimavirus]